MSRPTACLATCLALVLAACGGGGSKPEDDGKVAVNFTVHVPATTPAGSTITIAGDFNGWDPAAPGYALAEVAPLTYGLTLRFAVGTHIEFKFTRGGWDRVEKGVRGEEVPNRAFDVTGELFLDLSVGSWGDVGTSTVVGDVTMTTVPGFLGGRQVWIYHPPGYAASTARYPVLYMFDAQNVFDFQTSFAGEWKVDETLEALIPAAEVAPLIVVAVENGGGKRIDEYTPWANAAYVPSGGGDAHLDAIADVLVPWVDANHRTLTGPANTGLAGSSLGGLMTVYGLFARPDVFGRGMAMSSSIWWDDRHLVDYVTAAPAGKPSARLWTDMGTAECTECIADLRALRDALVAKGFTLGTDLEAVEAAGAGHNEAAWSGRFPAAVKWLFPPAP